MYFLVSLCRHFRLSGQSKITSRRGQIVEAINLAIVKRILELHKSTIMVKSELNRGTSFTFELPIPA
jgi:signal transduction histidine kinase